VSVGWDLRRQGDVLEVRRAALRLPGLEASGRGRLGPSAEVEMSARSELGAAFASAGVRLPAALAAAAPRRLGTVSFHLSLRGPLSNPARLRVVPRLAFEPADEATAALSFLRRPFRYRPPDAPGVEIDVREGAPGYVPLGEVPPLFLQALLISEDAGFYGHPGLDVAEVRMAWAANVERGEVARGGSTITQQLAKNLFLTQEKTYGRKLTEAALALVLDSAVPKARLLEIYLNVIEWGPGIHGLGPAARHYFGKAPAQLTPAETAFLVCLIPSPVRYHQAHAAGRVGPGMAQLMDNLLSKLVAAQVLSEDDYLSAVGEELAFSPEGG
jgi:membrane peptidoglycan carboxypeptidase